jgi:hypothetical protein
VSDKLPGTLSRQFEPCSKASGTSGSWHLATPASCPGSDSGGITLPAASGLMLTDAPGTVGAMNAQPANSPGPAGGFEVIHLGGEAAAIVPLDELRRLQALERHATPQAREEAEIEAVLAAHDEWVAAGCPGALSHEEVMAGLLGTGQ